MKRTFWRSLIGAIAVISTAALLRLAFPAFDLQYLAWIALVPMFLLFTRCGPLGSILWSFATGYLFYCSLLWWTLVRVSGFNPYNFGLGNVVQALHFGAFGIGAYLLGKRFPGWNPLTFPSMWAVLEYARSHAGFVSFPYGVLGYTQYRVLPVAGISTIAGVYGVSFLIVSVNTVIADVLRNSLSLSGTEDHRRNLPRGSMKMPLGIFCGIAVVFLAFVAYGHFQATKAVPGSLKAALIQGNLWWEEADTPERKEQVFGTYERLTRGLGTSKVDLIFWPSSSVPGHIPFERNVVERLAGDARGAGAYLLVGTAGFDKLAPAKQHSNRIANSAFLFSPGGDIVGRYDKMRLLPFDEYVPMRGSIPWPSWVVSPHLTDYVPGKEVTIFRMGKDRFGVLICWEYMFPDGFREMSAKGVDFMVAMTNEGFTASPSAHNQFYAMVVFRAIENHVGVIRTAATGISGIIDPAGRPLGVVRDPGGRDVEVAGTFIGSLPLSSQRTFYTLYGDLFVYLLCAVLGCFILFGILGGRVYLEGGPG